MTPSTTYQPTKDLEIKDGVYKTSLDGLYYLAHNFSPDKRGFFSEVGHTHKIEEIIGIPFKIAQVNLLAPLPMLSGACTLKVGTNW